jgi:hypothetical protein
LGTKVSTDVTQALAIGELAKGHAQELIQAGEALDVAVAVTKVDADLELVLGVKSIGWEKMVRPRFIGRLRGGLGNGRMSPKRGLGLEIEKSHDHHFHQQYQRVAVGCPSFLWTLLISLWYTFFLQVSGDIQVRAQVYSIVSTEVSR